LDNLNEIDDDDEELNEQIDILELDERQNEGYFKFLENCFTIYERYTLTLIALQFFNESASLMIYICCAIFFDLRGVSAVDATYYLCIIVSPEAMQLFWGVFSETVSIYGKRGHIIIGACL